MADNSTHAVGQMQGYLRQVQQMFSELISLEEVTVSVEALDDVAVQKEDGSIIADQMKSVTSCDNPATDRSPVFWKTLFNWLQYVQKGDLLLNKTVFRFLVISENDVTSGSIADQFNNATTVGEAKIALFKAQKELWGENEEKKNSIPTSYCEYLNELFNPKHCDTVCELIAKMSVIIYKNDYDDKLKEKFKAIPALYPEFSDNLYTDMFGWVMNRVVIQCKKGKPAYISKSEFDSALVAHQRAYNQTASIPALSSPINEAVLSGVVKSPHPDNYILQLEFIEADFTDKCKAASDYLRTKEEISIRAEKGLFTPDSMIDYTDRLKRSWSNARIRMRYSPGTDVEKGTFLFSETSDAVLKMKLQGADVPSFFGCGSLHDLANLPTDRPDIGWHPNYEALLRSDNRNE